MLNYSRIFQITLKTVVMCSLLFNRAMDALPAQAAEVTGLPIEQFLNPDGTLKVTTGYSGNLDITNYGVSLDPTRGPVFKPLAVSNGWNALGSGLISQVMSITVSGSDVYAGGYFSDAGGVANADYIARWNGVTWSALGTGLNNSVNVIVISGTDVYAGGNFTDAGGVVNADYIARFSGGTWSALGIGLNNSVNAIAISGTDVYAGGSFTDAGGIATADYIARWNGAAWSALGTGLNNFVFSIAISGSDVYTGGQFSDAGGVTNADAIARWNGAAWFALDTGLNGYVNSIAIGGGDVYAGGSFSMIGSGDYINIARFSGGIWSGLGTGLNDLVFTIVLSGSDVYAGGAFTNAGGNANADKIAKWNGTNWSALGSTPLTNFVQSIVLSGSDVYAGGAFTNAGGDLNADAIARFELPPPPITVNTPADELNADGDCSLREAIQSADTNLVVDACIGGSTSPDTILFSNALGTATITLLASNLPAITSTAGLTINGGSDITVSGNGSYRPFTVSSGALLTLDSLTVTNGFGSAFGGGLANNGGIVNITNSTFSGNNAGGSGAIDNNAGTLTVTNSTFYGNIATNNNGGAIYNYIGSTLTIRNSTISGNSATTGYGGGIYNSGAGAILNLYNTILANNSAIGGDCYKNSGTVSGDHNLIETDGAGVNACGTTAPINGNDPQLGALTGSPAYFPLNTGSPAINAGNDTVCAAAPVSNTSQNGVTRPQGIHCDIGAYELFFYKLFLPLIMR